jgi:hypothetical protein
VPRLSRFQAFLQDLVTFWKSKVASMCSVAEPVWH